MPLAPTIPARKRSYGSNLSVHNAFLSLAVLLLAGCSADEPPEYTGPLTWMYATEQAEVYSDRDGTALIGSVQKGDSFAIRAGDPAEYVKVTHVPKLDSGYIRRRQISSRSPVVRAPARASVRAKSGPAAEVVSARVVPFTTPMGPAQMALINWKNTGGTPIRVAYADIIPLDADGNELGSGAPDYTIFVAEDDSQAVQPGQTYREPNGEGYVLLPMYGRATRVKARITRVK